MNWFWFAIILIAGTTVCLGIYREMLDRETPAKARRRIEAAQRKAIKRHTRDLERESKRHTTIWKRHPIKP